MKNLPLTEIVPDKVYKYGSGKAGKTVRIICDKTQGWLRGHVLVRGFAADYTGFSAFVTLEPVFGGQNYDVRVSRRSFSDPWEFDNCGYAKMFHIHDKEVRDSIAVRIDAAALANPRAACYNSGRRARNRKTQAPQNLRAPS